jgi:hypothetical protein
MAFPPRIDALELHIRWRRHRLSGQQSGEWYTLTEEQILVCSLSHIVGLWSEFAERF